MTTSKQRKNEKAAAKFAPLIGCVCGSRRTVSERWHGRMIWKCENCERSVYADKHWEVSVGWFLGMSGQVDGIVSPYSEIKENKNNLLT